MSEGKDKYDERRRLEAENALLRERRENDRLKREEEGTAMLSALSAFIMGQRALRVVPYADSTGGGFVVRFDPSN